MQMINIIKELETIERAKEYIKKRNMIYQVDLKEEAAKKYGVPTNAYHDFCYEDWITVRQDYLRSREVEND